MTQSGESVPNRLWRLFSSFLRSIVGRDSASSEDEDATGSPDVGTPDSWPTRQEQSTADAQATTGTSERDADGGADGPDADGGADGPDADGGADASDVDTETTGPVPTAHPDDAQGRSGPVDPEGHGSPDTDTTDTDPNTTDTDPDTTDIDPNTTDTDTDPNPLEERDHPEPPVDDPVAPSAEDGSPSAADPAATTDVAASHPDRTVASDGGTKDGAVATESGGGGSVGVDPDDAVPEPDVLPDEPEVPGEETPEEDDDHDPESRGRTDVAAHLLEFTLDSGCYAVSITDVSAIMEMKKIARFPRGPDPVDGITDVRGEITAILDPKKALEAIETSGTSDGAYIIVLNRDTDKQQFGIRVDEVTEVETYSDDQIDTNSVLEEGSADAVEGEFIEGIVRKPTGDDTEIVTWLDMEAIIESIH
jgi:chemotaxis signal transduction protein